MITTMKWILLRAIMFFAFVLMAASSCTEESFYGQGETIRFGVPTVYENGPATKTEYSGKDQDNNSISSSSTHERIDWLPTDKIRIACDQASLLGSSEHFADYKIIPEATSGKTHIASLSPFGNGLQWGRGRHDFYAFYPSGEQNSDANIALSGSGAVVSGTIPVTQDPIAERNRVFKPDMDYAYMYAVAPNVNPGENVSLNFTPLVSTLEFTLLGKPGDVITSRLTSVKLSSGQTGSYLAGSFRASLTPGGLTPLTAADIVGGSNEITVNLGDGVQLSAANAYTVTFLTLPMAQSELTLILGFADGTKRTLALKDNGIWITVPACKKTYIWRLKAPLTLASYAIHSPIADIIQSGGNVLHGDLRPIRVSVDKTAAGTVTREGEWKAWFSSTAPDIGDPVESWSDSPLKDTGGNDWLTLSSYGGSGRDDDITVNFSGAPWSPPPTRDLMVDALRMTNELRSGPGAVNLDLSRYNILTGAVESSVMTANCYVIKTYGSYLIPCVYGNAYNNADAFRNNTTGSANRPVLNGFINADGNAIGDAVIPYDANLLKKGTLKAKVVWQDVAPGFEIITDADLEYISANGTGCNCPFIRITFQQDKIVPGNVVVALCDDDKILWSWHLWITAEPLSTVTIKESDNSTTRSVLNVNIGWTPPISYTGGNTLERSQYVIIASTATGKVLDVFRVAQLSYIVPPIDCTKYSHTYYQWGRKDPFLPSSGNDDYSNKAICYNVRIPGMSLGNTESTTEVEKVSVLGSVVTDNLAWMIKNPYIFITETAANYPPHYNLWNVAASDTFDRSVVKTVYDPSPRGFKVPNRNAFTGFTHKGEWYKNVNLDKIYGTIVNASGEIPIGIKFTTAYSPSSQTHTFYFPVSGFRYSDQSRLYFVSIGGYSWTAAAHHTNPNEQVGGKYFYYFNFNSVDPVHFDHRRTLGLPIRPIQE